MKVSVNQAIDDLRKGKFIILVDAPDRENEGDLICAAEKITSEHINFMITHAKGLVCMPMAPQIAEQLDLPLMTTKNTSKHGTAFTISVGAAEGITTGISPRDRAYTIQTAAKPNAVPQDLARPGHVFPLRAHPDGVLGRAGHTEATVDLVRLTGCCPIGVLCEIINVDGTMARGEDLQKFSEEYDIKILYIADLIDHFNLIHKNQHHFDKV